MHPVLVNVFGLFNIHTYGLMIALGFLIGMQLAQREARRLDVIRNSGYEKFVQDLTFWILIAAMIGSRILFIIVEWDSSYKADPLKIFRIWEGGLVFYGGLLGAIAFSLYYAWRKGRSFLYIADTLIPSVSLGQFFGRIGCFAAGCCWGDPVDPQYPLAVQFPPGSLIYNSMQKHGDIAVDAPASLHVHPVQIYESVGNLTLFFILIFLRSKKKFHGWVLCFYLFLYPGLRYTVETFRGDIGRGENVLHTPFSTSQLVSVCLFTIGAIIFIVQSLKAKDPTTPTPPAAVTA